MSSKKENNEYIAFKSILSKFDQAKNNLNELYRKIPANAEENYNDLDKLINNYKTIIENLKQIKNESYELDNYPVPEICFQSDDIVNEERINNFNGLLSLAQHIRGCHQSFSEYNSKIK